MKNAIRTSSAFLLFLSVAPAKAQTEIPPPDPTQSPRTHRSPKLRSRLSGHPDRRFWFLAAIQIAATVADAETTQWALHSHPAGRRIESALRSASGSPQDVRHRSVNHRRPDPDATPRKNDLRAKRKTPQWLDRRSRREHRVPYVSRGPQRPYRDLLHLPRERVRLPVTRRCRRRVAPAPASFAGKSPQFAEKGATPPPIADNLSPCSILNSRRRRWQ